MIHCVVKNVIRRKVLVTVSRFLFGNRSVHRREGHHVICFVEQSTYVIQLLHDLHSAFRIAFPIGHANRSWSKSRQFVCEKVVGIGNKNRPVFTFCRKKDVGDRQLNDSIVWNLFEQNIKQDI